MEKDQQLHKGYSPNMGYPLAEVNPSQPAPGATTVVVASPIIAAYGPRAQPMTCPHCNVHVTTKISAEPGMRTHLIALMLCIIGCIPCCLLPYWMDSCKNINHYCPSCSAFLGTYDSERGAAAHRF